MKFHLCRCEHKENCSSPCVYHFANKCPDRKGVTDKKNGDKTKSGELGLFMQSNFNTVPEEVLLMEENENFVLIVVETAPTQVTPVSFHEEEAVSISALTARDPEAEIYDEHADSEDNDDFVLIVKESLEEIVLVAKEEECDALIDCACPITVSGKKWTEEEDKKLVVKKPSEKIYKFGGGEKRKSLGKIIFPCHMAGRNVKMTSEVVEADFPLLLGNTSLKKADAVLFPGREKAILMGTEVTTKETSTRHFSLRIDKPITGKRSKIK